MQQTRQSANPMKQIANPKASGSKLGKHLVPKHRIVLLIYTYEINHDQATFGVAFHGYVWPFSHTRVNTSSVCCRTFSTAPWRLVFSNFLFAGKTSPSQLTQ